MALDISKFIDRFIGEARDHLARLETGLAALESRPDDPEAAVNELFRSAHTIKGSARMLKLLGIAETAHRMEDLLGALRAGDRRADPAGISLLLQGVDAIAAQLDQVESSGGDPPTDPALCAALARAAAGDDGTGPAAEPTRDLPVAAPAVAAAQPAPTAAAAPQYRAPDSVRVPLTKLDELIRLIGEVTSVQVKLRQRLLEAQALGRTGTGRGPPVRPVCPSRPRPTPCSAWRATCATTCRPRSCSPPTWASRRWCCACCR